ncbi:retrotransposon protein, putative, ty1-copia subclass [Tanacetum coccineum]|uniref:Retrotransposon protein, putative, ty1-copia subclass n=1 Tax=Tanacetum coccineum TaxID=301880 RepID=A0ABQ5A2F8_9ASTR
MRPAASCLAWLGIVEDCFALSPQDMQIGMVSEGLNSEIAPTSDPKEAVCFYCNTKGHWKRSCPKYLKDLKDGKVKKGDHSSMYMIELHNTTTSDSWVLDTGCGTYICDVLQGLKESRRLKHGELNLVMGKQGE